MSDSEFSELETAVDAIFSTRDLYVSFIDTAYGLTPTRTRVPESVFMETYLKISDPESKVDGPACRYRITLVDLSAEEGSEYESGNTLTGEPNFFTVMVTAKAYREIQTDIAIHLAKTIESW